MKKLILIIGLAILLTSCLPQQDAQTTTKTESSDIKAYSLTEIAQHNTEKDCWLLISGQVYDVTKFIASHPGGKALLGGCGQDATIFFLNRPMGSGTEHSTRAKSMLDDYYIGNLTNNAQ